MMHVNCKYYYLGKILHSKIKKNIILFLGIYNEIYLF